MLRGWQIRGLCGAPHAAAGEENRWQKYPPALMVHSSDWSGEEVICRSHLTAPENFLFVGQ
jgi:hypothetical protein